jgi:hypothetical protein
MNRMQILALVVGAAFVALGLWQMVAAPVTAPPAPAEQTVAEEG